jgi:hypothetical protein
MRKTARYGLFPPNIPDGPHLLPPARAYNPSVLNLLGKTITSQLDAVGISKAEHPLPRRKEGGNLLPFSGSREGLFVHTTRRR